MFKFTYSTSLYKSISPNSAFRAGMHVLKKELVQDNIYYDLGVAAPLELPKLAGQAPKNHMCAAQRLAFWDHAHTCETRRFDCRET